MGQTLTQYTGDAVEQVWDSVQELLLESIQYSNGEITLENIRWFLHRENMQLWVGSDDGKAEAVMITEFVVYPQYKVVRITQLAGKFSKYFDKYSKYFINWAVVNGAISIESYSRPAMTRYLKRLKARKVYDVCRISLKGYLS